jgi:transglutaminase-like putative cysteine protease
MLILLNLAYAPRVGSVSLVLYAGAACVLAARYHAFRREQEWRRVSVPVPPRLPWHFLTAGVNVALLVVIVGWAAPLSLRSTIAQDTWERLEEPRQAVERRMDRWFSAFGGPGRASGSYAGFDDSFQLGGPLSLGDEPVMLLRGRQATYLAGQRYDRYDGRGWSTGVNRTFRETDANGKRFSPQVTFQADQAIQLSPDITGDRERVQSAITLIRPKRDLLFASDTYLTSDRATSVQLSWRQLVDEPVAIGADADDGVPPDLLYLMSLLRRATFTEGADGATTVNDPTLAAQIADEREALADRFLSVEWELDRGGKVETLFVSGQVPVYDDVEAVFDQGEPAVGTSYTVTSAASAATPDELRSAGTAYPDYVRARYLELPSSVTPRTERLAQNIAAASDNPFDIAAAIEDHVRGRIAYTENIPFPPDDQDVVDYVLFDSKQGYCEYYASAMAVMLRSLDIPARIVAGYYPGDFDPESGGYLYRELNAHAWVEVFFPGYGWIAFEPTAARAELAYGEDIPDDTEPATPPVDAVETPGPEPTAEASPAVPPADGQTPTDAQPSLLERASRQPGWKPGLAATALLLLALVAALFWLWGFRGLSPAGSLYARALRLGGWRGVRPHPTMTPHEYAAELGRVVPAAQVPARTVADLYVVEQYAGQPPPSGAARAATHAWRSLRRALLRPRLGRRQRLASPRRRMRRGD